MKHERLIPAGDEDQSSLAARISAIVFWGMVWIGLLGAFALLRGLENSISERYQTAADHIAHEVDSLLDRGTANLEHRFAARLAHEHIVLDVRGVTVRLDNDRTLTLGDAGDPSTRLERVVEYRDGGALRSATISVHLPSLNTTLVAKRNQTLLLLGSALIAFGLVLQWLLRRAITRPFEQMIRSARAFTAGDLAQRFDEKRRDEFGFLARFINDALDYSHRQQLDLRDALTRVQASESELFAEKERIATTLHSIGDAVITTGADGRIDYLNPAAEQLTGWTAAATRGQLPAQIMQLIDEKSREPLEHPVERCLRDGETIGNTEHVILQRTDGGECDISHSVAPIRDRDGRCVGAVMVLHDVGQAQRLARQLSYQASHDALTGLSNRLEFERRLHEALDGTDITTRGHATCYLDMDQFKLVNDTCGHTAGDELLRRIAALLRGHVRDADVVARLGGDEFGILLLHCGTEHAERVMQDLLDKIRALRFTWGEHSFDVSASIGMVHVPPGRHTPADILSAADVACYAAKETGRNRLHIYRPDDDELRRRRADMHWVSRLHKALDANRFLLYAQPIVPLRSAGGEAGYHEVLVRLLDEEGRLVPPNAFIPAAERYNLMPQIDRWVIRTLCAELVAQPRNRTRFTVNLSGQSLCDAGFLDFIIHEIETSGIEPARLCFEITETAAISQLERATALIAALRNRGCRFALDDFGSGLSSFAYLKNLAVDYIKIDGAFVKHSAENPIDRAMVAAIHTVGEAMGIRTIAEFVENGAIRAVLEEIGVHFAQGYGIARPAPIAELFANDAAGRVRLAVSG